MKRSPLKPSTKPLVRKTPMRASAKVKVFRPRMCEICRVKFRPVRDNETWCSPEHGAEVALRKVAAATARADRAKLVALEPLSYWEDKAQKAVNRYVRARDYGLGCVSCDLPPTWGGQWHASHLRTVAAASAVRYHLWNIHKACSSCNKHKSGNVGEYLRRLPARMSQERIDWLYTQNQIVRHDRQYLQRMARVFNKKAARQERRNARSFP